MLSEAGKAPHPSFDPALLISPKRSGDDRMRDGPKMTSQGFRQPWQAGMTNRADWLQLLDYTDGELTVEVARAMWDSVPPERWRAVLEALRSDPVFKKLTVLIDNAPIKD
jgi:hypothetical protein